MVALSSLEHYHSLPMILIGFLFFSALTLFESLGKSFSKKHENGKNNNQPKKEVNMKSFRIRVNSLNQSAMAVISSVGTSILGGAVLPQKTFKDS